MSSALTPSGKTYGEVADRLALDARNADVEARSYARLAKIPGGSLAETAEERRVRLAHSAGVHARYCGRLLALAEGYRNGQPPRPNSDASWYTREAARERAAYGG